MSLFQILNDLLGDTLGQEVCCIICDYEPSDLSLEEFCKAMAVWHDQVIKNEEDEKNDDSDDDSTDDSTDVDTSQDDISFQLVIAMSKWHLQFR